jgi:vancomycin resistance protein VanJ
MVLFGPRWFFVLPLLVLLPATLVLRRKSLCVLATAAWIGLVPIMGLSIPWRAALSHHQGGPALRVLTCNLHGTRTNAQALRSAIESQKPDIVALQEWSSAFDATFPRETWHTCRVGELLLASRYPIDDILPIDDRDFVQPGAAARFSVHTPNGVVQVVNLHLASPHNQFDDVLQRSASGGDAVESNSRCRRSQSMAIGRYVHGLGAATIVTGDFNTPDDSVIFRESWSGLSDAFQTAGWGFGYTYYAHKTSVRIDHLLAAGGLRCGGCWVGPEVGSPHRPVIADLEWIAVK